MQAPLATHLTGPIPGESLTRQPGSVPWERPPEHTTVDSAMHMFLQKFQDKDMVHQFLATMEMGAPLDTVIRTILMHGFGEGKWAPSLGVLLIKPLHALLSMMLKKSGIKYIESYTPKKGQLNPQFNAIQKKQQQDQVKTEQVTKFLAQTKAQLKKPDLAPTQLTAETAPKPPSEGLMAPPSTPQGQ